MTIIVIIILAVAVILSIANNNPIENAKEAKFKSDLKTIQEELTLKQASNYVDEHANNKTPSEISIDDLASATNYKDKLTIKDGKLCVTSGASEEERKVAKELGIETKDPITFTKQGELKIGSEVTANGENFYVIGGNEVGKAISSDTQTVILLTKYCLKKENGEITLKQDTSVAYNSCAFSSRNYWNSAEGIAYPDTDGKYPDLNNEKKYPIGNETSIITKAKEYGKSLNVEGRLMTVEEIVKLGGSISESSTSECPNYITNGQKYWLGSAYDQGYVWGVYSDDENNIKSLSYDSYGTASGGGGFGLRPVIEVPVSSIN